MRLQRQCIRYFVISTCRIKAASHVTSSRAHQHATWPLLRFADLLAAMVESWQNVSDMQRVYMSVRVMAECHVGCDMLWTHPDGPTLFPSH